MVRIPLFGRIFGHRGPVKQRVEGEVVSGREAKKRGAAADEVITLLKEYHRGFGSHQERDPQYYADLKARLVKLDVNTIKLIGFLINRPDRAANDLGWTGPVNPTPEQVLTQILDRGWRPKRAVPPGGKPTIESPPKSPEV